MATSKASSDISALIVGSSAEQASSARRIRGCQFRHALMQVSFFRGVRRVKQTK